MTIEGRTDGASGSALDAVAEASRALTTGGTLREALASIAAAAASATGAEVVVARVLAADARQLKAHAVWAVSPAVLLWRAAEEDEGLELLGSFGLQAAEPEVARAGEAAGRALAERQPVAVEGGAPRRGARDAAHPLVGSGAAARGRDRGDGARDRWAGRARNRQRPSLPAAEGLRRHDAAVAPPARRARPRGARARRRLRVVGAGRRRRRRLRLPPAPGRPARGRARRRHGARDRGHGRHGDGEVRLPLARARAPRARRLRGTDPQHAQLACASV